MTNNPPDDSKLVTFMTCLYQLRGCLLKTLLSQGIIFDRVCERSEMEIQNTSRDMSYDEDETGTVVQFFVSFVCELPDFVDQFVDLVLM